MGVMRRAALGVSLGGWGGVRCMCMGMGMRMGGGAG